MSELKKKNIARLKKLSERAPQLQIEPMDRCLHNQECGFLNAPGIISPTCGMSRELLFDLKECPVGYWKIRPPMFGEKGFWEPPTVTAKRKRELLQGKKR